MPRSNNNTNTPKGILDPTSVSSLFVNEEDVLHGMKGAKIQVSSTGGTTPGQPVQSGFAPILIREPTLGGTAQQGQTLNFTPGFYIGAPTPSVTSVWMRDGVELQPNTTNLFPLNGSHIGSSFQVKETVTNSSGTLVRYSPASSSVIALPLPGARIEPVITGTPLVGQTLFLVVGAYDNGGIVDSVSWTLDGVATGNQSYEYIVQQADVGKQIRVVVTVSNAAGSSYITTLPLIGFGPIYSGDTLHILSADPFIELGQLLTGQVVIDPIYGSNLRKLTDYQTDSTGSIFMKGDTPVREVYNFDGTKYLAKSSTGSWIAYSSDGQPIGKLTMDPSAEPVWKHNSPDEIIYTAEFGGLIHYEKNVLTDVDQIFVDFTGRLSAFPSAARVWLRGGCPSADGRFWAFSVESQNLTHLGVFSYDSLNDTIVGTLPAATHAGGKPEWVSASPSGARVVISFSGAKGTMSYPVDLTGSGVNIAASAPVGDLAFGSALNDLFCYMDEASNAVKVADCTTGNSFTLMNLSWGTGVSTEISKVSISGKAYDRPGWIFLCGYGERFADATYTGTLTPTREPWRKIMAARLVSFGNVYNIAYTQITADYGGYHGIPNVTPSRDGRKAAFASNWGGQGGIDLYEVSIPDELSPGLPAAPQFVQPPTVTVSSGVYMIGNQISCIMNGINGEPFPVISYQWRKDSVAINGAVSDNYTPSEAGNFSCEVTLTNSEGTVSSVTSAVAIAAPNVALATRVASSQDLSLSKSTNAFSQPMDCSAGDLIIVSGNYSDDTQVGGKILATVTDTAGNTYVALPEVVCPDRESRLRLWYCTSSNAQIGNVVTLMTPGTYTPITQMRASVYNPGAGHRFVYDTESHIARGYAYGDIVVPAFDTSGQGVIYISFADNATYSVPFSRAAPTGFTYLDNIGGSLVSADRITNDAQVAVLAYKPVTPDYSRGAVQAVSFVIQPIN